MKNQLNKDQKKKRILNLYNYKQRNIDYLNQERVNKKFEILTKKVLSKHEPITKEKRKQLKEKRLNTIFNKNDYNYSNNEINQNNDLLQKKNSSFLINEKSNNNFLEKYKELFGFTKNNYTFNDNSHNKIRSQNMLRYYLNILKSNNNEKYAPKNFKINIISSKIRNLSQRKQQLKRNYKILRDEIFENLNKDNSKNIYNGINQSIKTKINKNNILKVLYKNGNLTQNNNIIDNFILTSKNDSKKNNYSNLVNNSSSMRFYSSKYNQIRTKLDIKYDYNYFKRDRPIYNSKKNFKKSNNANSSKNNTYSNYKQTKNKYNFDIFSYYNNDERIDNKVKNFNTRINILLIK